MAKKIITQPLFLNYCDSQDFSPRIYKHWEHLFNNYGSDYSMYQTNEMYRLIKNGIPYNYKAKIWAIRSGAMTEMILNPGEYTELLARSTRIDAINFEEIERDLYRYIIYIYYI